MEAKRVTRWFLEFCFAVFPFVSRLVLLSLYYGLCNLLVFHHLVLHLMHSCSVKLSTSRSSTMSIYLRKAMWCAKHHRSGIWMYLDLS